MTVYENYNVIAFKSCIQKFAVSERIERFFFTKSHPKLPVSGSMMTGRMIIITTGKIMNVGQIMGSRKKC